MAIHQPPHRAKDQFSNAKTEEVPHAEDVTQTSVKGRRSPLPMLDKDRYVLSVLTGPALGTVFTIDFSNQDLVLGRGPNASGRIDDATISRMHARIFFRDERVHLEDMGSRNGTFLEGQRIETTQQLEPGNRIQLGPQTLLRFDVLDAIEHQAALQVYEWTVRDPLTRLYNRRYLDERLSAEFAYAIRRGTRLSLLVLDIDHFKQVNDVYGHQAGDALLSGIAGFLQRIVRSEDIVARYGGEEFVIALRDVSHADSMRLAERIRSSLEKLTIPWNDATINITASVGVATHTPEQGAEDFNALISGADQALYMAKMAGRNCVKSV